MSRFSLRAYRLRPLGPRAPDHIAQLRILGPKTSKNLLLPYATGLGYFVIPAASGGLVIDSLDFHVEPLYAATSLWVRLRLALLFKKKKYLAFEDFSVFSYGRKPERKRFTTFNQHMFNIGVSLDGDLISEHPELLEGWGDEEALQSRVSSRERVRIRWPSSCTSITRRLGPISPACCVASLFRSTSSSRPPPVANRWPKRFAGSFRTRKSR